MHAYFQVVSGDSLVKSYRLPIEELLLQQTRYLDGVRIPTPEAELVLFALRIALKHTGPIEILMANRHYREVSRELGWLREEDAERAEALCTTWFPTIDPPLFRHCWTPSKLSAPWPGARSLAGASLGGYVDCGG